MPAKQENQINRNLSNRINYYKKYDPGKQPRKI